MAGNKINTKSKGKDEKNKTNKQMIDQNNEETEEPDFALLRKPVLTNITGFCQARKIYDNATEELKGLLSNECDLLYECKVCRNIFRSLANFISHKRVYCKEKFNISIHGHFIKPSSTLTEIMKIKHMEEDYQESLKNDIDLDATDERIPLSKDLTAIIEKIVKNKGAYEGNIEEAKVNLQKIPNSSVAMFQNLEINESNSNDSMRTQVNEIHKILSKDMAVLQSDGNFKIQCSNQDADSVIQISDDDGNDDGDDLKCKTCDLQFSTQKTLKFHMKYKHVESRLVYPCPDCLEIFSTSWSVYRHLFKVHRKTAAQIRRLRESIQSKAFKMNNPPAFYEKRKNMKSVPAQKISEEERLDQENQVWMENIECSGVPRCGGCGRTFERRAALAAHAHTCVRHRPPARARRIQIQIRRDYNKGPPPLTLPPSQPQQPPDPPASVPHDDTKPSTVKEEKEEDKTAVDEKETEETAMDISEDDQKSIGSDSPEKSPEKVKINVCKPIIRLPYARQQEKSNLVALTQKIQPDIELDKLLCKKCDSKHNTIQELYDHVAEHYKWMRYACKLCNYKHYQFEKLPEHVKIVHKLKGDTEFYFSTVKAIDGPKALELCEPCDDVEMNEASSESRRPSRCSSDSSRLSDDSMSSSTRLEVGSRKRKAYTAKNYVKKKKDSPTKVGDEEKDDVDKISCPAESDTGSHIKQFEENSSDIDEIEEKMAKRQTTEDTASVASRRSVRRKAKRKNEDFEYDLSNLLKMEAQGYRESQSVIAKPNQPKRKAPHESQIHFENLNKDCCGALLALSKNSVEVAGAHIKTAGLYISSIHKEPLGLFIRPMKPKNIVKSEKNSPKKDINEEQKDPSSSNQKDLKDKPPKDECSKNSNPVEAKTATKDVSNSHDVIENNDSAVVSKKVQNNSTKLSDKIKSLPGLPIKLRRQSMEVIKNPIINKNISDFTKSGMKTKILVIKPINRNKDGTQEKVPLKFQTIKLKDPSKSILSNENNPVDPVVVVQVPKVSCSVATSVDSSTSDKQSVIVNTPNEITQNIEKSEDDEHTKTKLSLNINGEAEVTSEQSCNPNENDTVIESEDHEELPNDLPAESASNKLDSLESDKLVAAVTT